MVSLLTVLVKEVGKRPYVKEIPDDLKALQRLVGGYIEVVSPKPLSDMGIILVCNEEGLINDLDINMYIIRRDGTPLGELYGNVFFISSKGEDFKSLSKEQIEYLESVLIEVPIRGGSVDVLIL